MTKMRSSFRSFVRRSAAAVIVVAAGLAATHAAAVGTRTFTLDSLEDLKGGDLTGVAVDSNGNVFAGLNLGKTPIADATSVWSAVVLPDGAALLGTGSEGKIYRVAGGKVSVAATTDQMAVSAMAVAWNGDVIAGTFPEGKLFRLAGGTAGKGAGEKAKVFAELPGTEDVWGLAYDEKAKVLYAATGPEGKLYRVDAQGKAQVYFDSEEPHLVSVAVGEDGAVYTGSNGKGLLYKLTGPGRATVLHDFDADDVKAIVVAPAAKGGAIYAIANKYSEPFASPKRNKSGPPSPQPARTPKPGKGTLTRFSRDGVAEKLLSDDDTHYVSLGLGEDGAPYVGTGAEGRLYTVSENRVERLVADTEERQVGAFVLAGKQRFVATTDPAVFHEVRGVGGADAVWTSKVLDAGLRASFGRLTWRSGGALQFETRSGNTETPDTSWSTWSPALAAPGDVKSPPGRFVQVRARWNKEPQAVLREVSLSFVTDNARTVITSVGVKNQTRATKPGVQASGGEAPKPSSSVQITWQVDNPDQDEMRYRLWYRMEGQTPWRSLLKPGEKVSRTEYTWDTTAMPEGEYRILVEATDEMANPPDRAQKHTLESGVVLVDNTPPVFRSLALQGRRLRGEVVDGLGPVARIEVSIAGSEEWRPLFPSDGIFDEAAEAFDADITAVVPAGSHLVAVRAYDSSGNVVTRDVDAR
ncbi:hypothetical protein [Chondromyces apiculatus]|uniref:Fibronectin type-III domain-containing protein n=1 Tax=Chondromyces apiculatus DSM 436 TaxID=1192034 RepID=A0A017TB62_9BACT|nr:hypothetical protein [Chondromyces apiculatus]EYF06479.1 Hypothetical protein CAP_2009 [Chondromyces apiculatus DSM 436]